MPGRFRVKKQPFDSLGVKEPVTKIKLIHGVPSWRYVGPMAASFLATSHILWLTPRHGSWFGLDSGSQVVPSPLDVPVPGLPGFLSVLLGDPMVTLS